jgi:hypothetical protein
LGTQGEKWREKALMHQMPKQDISIDFCKFVASDSAIRKYNEFIEIRNSNALDIGICFKNLYNDLVNILIYLFNLIYISFYIIFKKCKHCEDVIDIDSLYVHASSSNNDNNYDDSKIEKIENNWHPTCIFII